VNIVTGGSSEVAPRLSVTVPGIGAVGSRIGTPTSPSGGGAGPALAEPGAAAADADEAAERTSTHRQRVRDRLARRIVSPRGSVRPELEPLLAMHKEAHAKADTRLLERGYEVAARQHAGQLRKSGDPYITHPLAVAMIVAELGMDTTTLVAALLHDTVEDTGLSLDAIHAISTRRYFYRRRRHNSTGSSSGRRAVERSAR
jgi:GTP pyrophosphokinase